MNLLVIGVGNVGNAILHLLRDKKLFEKIYITDRDHSKINKILKSFKTSNNLFAVELTIDKAAIFNIIKDYNVNYVVNALAPNYNMEIFNACYESGANYIDMAASISSPHTLEPNKKTDIKLGDLQFAQTSKWEERGILALLGMGMDPGISDVCAKYAVENIFDSINEIKIRDGNNLSAKGFEFVLGFSIWTVIEECLAPPVIWDKQIGWYTTTPFSEPEVYPFPHGIGTLECVNVEHEEVLFIPRYIEVDKVTFKYALGSELIKFLKLLHKYNLTSTDKIEVKGKKIAPRDLVEACMPRPDQMLGRAIGKVDVCIEVTGLSNGKSKTVLFDQFMDNQQIIQEHNCGVVGFQTASGLVTALELLIEGYWSGSGVHAPERFNATKFVDLYKKNGFNLLLRELSQDDKLE